MLVLHDNLGRLPVLSQRRKNHPSCAIYSAIHDLVDKISRSLGPSCGLIPTTKIEIGIRSLGSMLKRV
ncbi:hypothetical protein GGTG_00639 [Gaeumannomyces tritici R3-111a-1]|uniref:Uncharacterized protein n=1 Tax=Gaeumannomyces tritici (strain R3-111a-1) TaxID=644352 RepID=J3NHA2_GAET3|nr:hypothetical protein GGTG_00639 [Gaeumannomyces tritici R3-111a-1]EJT80645.1 hypothetical protein GGTG_00639 [Gaeumannomyces tritici R3-111a-1]